MVLSKCLGLFLIGRRQPVGVRLVVNQLRADEVVDL
jgi:hypothetical protein